MELISPKLVVAKDIQNLVPTAKNLQKIKVLKQSLPDNKDNETIQTKDFQSYLALLSAYREDEDYTQASQIANKILVQSKKRKDKNFAFQAQYMLICSLFDDNKIYDGKILLKKFLKVNNNSFNYLHYCALAKYYGLKNNSKKEIKTYQKAFQISIKSNLDNKIKFEILCALALAFENDQEFNRALTIYNLLQTNKFDSKSFLTEEENISIDFRKAIIFGYLESNDKKLDYLKNILSKYKSLKQYNSLRSYIINEYNETYNTYNLNN